MCSAYGRGSSQIKSRLTEVLSSQRGPQECYFLPKPFSGCGRSLTLCTSFQPDTGSKVDLQSGPVPVGIGRFVSQVQPGNYLVLYKLLTFQSNPHYITAPVNITTQMVAQKGHFSMTPDYSPLFVAMPKRSELLKLALACLLIAVAIVVLFWV